MCCATECFRGECRVIFNKKTISKKKILLLVCTKRLTLQRITYPKFFRYSSDVHEYRYYRKYWQPQAHPKLVCVHEKDNPYYDFFAIKTADITSGMTVDDLLMEHFRFTKFFLDRGARMFYYFNIYKLLYFISCTGRLRNSMSN